jgi:1-acyl-sn-glycerol-3-phosphate acyltransferase
MRLAKLPHLIVNTAVLATYFGVGFVLQWITRDPIKRRRRAIRFTSTMCRVFLKTLNIEIEVEGREKLQALHKSSYLLVSNHSSYTDILVLSSLENLVFITSVEMGNNPVLGDITRLGGCLYTDRKKPVSLPKEIQRFSATISEGFKVVLFPEGTSTDARSIKDFRASLFQVAIGARATILPVCISYQSVDGQPFGDNNRDTICWYGDMDFVPHFIGLLNHQIGVRVTILDPIPFDPNLSRAELSDRTREALLKTYHIDR